MRLLNIKEVQGMQLELMKKLHKYFFDHDLKYYLIAGSALGSVRHGGFIPWDDDIDIGMFRAEYERFLSMADDFDNGYEIINYRNSSNCDYCLTRIYFPDTMILDECVSKTKLDKRLYLDIFPLDNVPDSMEERILFEKELKKAKRLLGLVDARKYDNSKIKYFVKKIVSLCLGPFRKQILKNINAKMIRYENQNTENVCSLCSQYSFSKQVMEKCVYGTPTLRSFEGCEFFMPENIERYLTILYGENYMQIPPESKRRKGHDIYIISEK